MITMYHRPQTLDEALTFLARPNTLPLGGGTLLTHPTADSFSVVDLQQLGLDSLRVAGNELQIGATYTLQALYESDGVFAALKTAIKLEAPLNIRNAATVAGTLVASDGRSPFAAMLLALDSKVEYSLISNSSSATSSLSEYLLARPRGLITSIVVPRNTKSAFEYVAKTPSDKPLVGAAVAQWNSGRTRFFLCGYGKTPLLALDGTEERGIQDAARNAYHEADDEWASAEYRMDVGATLARRALENLT